MVIRKNSQLTKSPKNYSPLNSEQKVKPTKIRKSIAQVLGHSTIIMHNKAYPLNDNGYKFTAIQFDQLII